MCVALFLDVVVDVHLPVVRGEMRNPLSIVIIHTLYIDQHPERGQGDARAKMQGQVKWAIIFKASNF